MNFWWVNQNQTHKYEIQGGYMWSPKKNANGAKNTFYDNMTKVRPGDIVFSFFDQKISYLGIIKSHGYSRIKPDLGAAGNAWDNEGWMVTVDYRQVRNSIIPKNHIADLRNLLPDKYSPLQKDTGKGLQGVYLASIKMPLAEKLLELIGEDTLPVLSEGLEHQCEIKTDLEAEEERIEKIIKKDPTIPETEKESLVKSRKGQGKFRKEVLELHVSCPFTGVANPKFLKAGHLKPWSRCVNNFERLDPLNGIPLTPVADYLLDNGYLTFDNKGHALFSNTIAISELKAMGIDPFRKYNIKILDQRQRQYLKYHRHNIFVD